MNSTSPRRRRHAPTALLAALTAAGLALAGCSATPSSTSTDGTSYTIGVFELAQADLIDSVVAAFEKSVKKELGSDVTVTFDLQNANGDQSLTTSLARDFASSDDDAFAVIGTPAVIALAQQIKDKPIFALAMGDPVGAGLAKSLDEPGGNVTGSIDYVEPALLLDKMLKIQPDLTSVGTVYDPSNQNMQVWVKALKKAAAEDDLTVTEATISGSSDVAQAARSLNGRADSVLIGPDATVIAGLDAVTAAATGSGTPLYISGGDASVAGVLASIGPDYPLTGTSAGKIAAKVLLGADPATTAFAVPTGLDVTINGATAKQLDLTIAQDVLDSATVL